MDSRRTWSLVLPSVQLSARRRYASTPHRTILPGSAYVARWVLLTIFRSASANGVARGRVRQRLPELLAVVRLSPISGRVLLYRFADASMPEPCRAPTAPPPLPHLASRQGTAARTGPRIG